MPIRVSVEAAAAKTTPAGSARDAWGSLRPIHGQSIPSPAMSLSGKSSKDFYLDCMDIQGNLPTLLKADKRRGQIVLDWYNHFASPQERALLLPPALQGAGENRRFGLILVLVARSSIHFTILSSSDLRMLLQRAGRKSHGTFHKENPYLLAAWRRALASLQRLMLRLTIPQRPFLSFAAR